MRLGLSLSRQAENYLMRQPVNLQRRINERLEEIAVDEASKAKTLRGRQGQLSSRVGGFRILYVVDRQDGIVKVLKIGPRGDVYKRG